MTDKDKKMLEAKARILKALGHPTRLYIIEELFKGEKCVCEFVASIGADFSTVSKHLSVLKEAGIIRDDKRGQKIFYRLQMPCIMNFIGCIGDVIRKNLEAQIAMFEQR